MRRTLSGKRAIVTGASGGIGKAIAKALAAAGAKVALAARTADKLAAVAAEIGGNALAVPADVTKPADRENLIRTTVAQFGGLDLLVNVAGVGAWGHFATSTEAINREVLEVNFFAPTELIRLAVPHLARGNQPAICNLTSMCGRRGMPAWPEYSASKFALVGLTEALRGEMARYDIDVVTIVPGLTASDLNRHLLRNDGKADIPYDKGMSPEYVAGRTVDAICRGKREILLGLEAKKILLINRFAPRLVDRLIARAVKKLYQKN
ncbi:SDR family NAD(P)-dependent oxidoreductase [Limnoglobus roseus]|uniref:KR domain-containing protein n=1 Tax=Limnoglobus roseus TaxID=2598579 RepID=A0A5C1AA42_9BACT|nr:SDR family NAD(P)-dependent oxidoreductase [Limnoglobus roseus]QEL13908.1 KR domain-containing protein [Limnoglobus roseus]